MLPTNNWDLATAFQVNIETFSYHIDNVVEDAYKMEQWKNIWKFNVSISTSFKKHKIGVFMKRIYFSSFIVSDNTKFICK